MQNTDQTIQLPFTTSHAFIVGINDYQHLTPLSTAVNDARMIAENLENQHDFKVHPPLLNATHESLRKLLTKDIPQLVGKDDRVLFYFAGHGIALDGEEGPNGYLVAADTRPGQEETLIPMQMLHDALTGLPCRHGLLILDCCFSGAFKWSSGYRDVIFDLPKVIYEERFWRYCKDEAWQVITSSAHDQKAVDIITNQSLGLREEGDGGNHSPFANSLLKALAGEGDMVPAGTGDGVMTATEIYSYLRDSVETQTTENAKRQSPSIFNLQRHDKGEFIFLTPNHRFNLPPTPDRNPFMGLSSFNEEDANLFYGRDRVVLALLDKIKQQSLVVVSGASGTGKSSVIKAGVLPQLRKERYTVLPIIRPGKEPLETLLAELPDVKNQLETRPTVLVIDQYEELITQCLKEEDRLRFEERIAGWLERYPDLRILLSIRSDFEPQFESEILAPWWQKGRYVVPAFSLEEIREVITKPAAQAVLFYEPEDLVEQLSEEVSQAPGALPLLSFTLSELYHKYLKSGREDRALTESDYNELGGVIGALRTRADAEYTALNPEKQSSMRKLMLRMVSLEGGELAGKRVYEKELQFKSPAETNRLLTIANQLVDARLLLKGTDGQGRSYIEPAHDALVRAWARLWEWIKTVGEEKIALQYKLSQAVNDYHDLLASAPKKARNLLWNSNPRLDLLKAELEGKDHGFNAQEALFVENSIKRRSARKRTNWAIAIAVMLGLAGLAWVANSQRISAVANAQIAEDRAKEVQDSAKVAAAQRTRADSEAVKAIANSLASQSALVRLTDPTVAFRLAEASLDRVPENTLGKGALLSAFYSNVIKQQAGLFYHQVNKMPYEQNFEKRQDESAPENLPPTEWHEYRNADKVQAFNSRKGNYYFEARDEHGGAFYLELADLKAQQWSIRKYPDNEVLFGPPSFDPAEQRVIIPDENILQFCAPADMNTPLYQLAAPSAVEQAYFAAQGKQVFAKTYDGRYFNWRLSAYNIPTININNLIDDLYWGPDGQTLVVVENDVQVWIQKSDKWQLRGSLERGQLRWSADKKSLLQEGFSTIDLTSYLHYSNKDYGYNGRYQNVPDPSLYKLSYPDKRRSMTVQELKGARRKVSLIGHVGQIQSIAVAPDGESILTSSGSELKLWDWQGNNFFSMKQGGNAGFLPPDGRSLFLISFVPEDDSNLDVGSSNIQILPITTAEIRQWVKEHDIYKLNTTERVKYGID